MPMYELANKGLGTSVRRAREEINYSVGDLAETSGLAEEEIMEIETGHCRDRKKLHRIAAALQISIDQLRV